MEDIENREAPSQEEPELLFERGNNPEVPF